VNREDPSMPVEYWERRAQRFAGRGRGLAAVCSYGMPAFYNAYIEACQRRALAPFLKLTGRVVLDVGCGVGRWSLELARRGNDVTGVDVSSTMIAQSRARAVKSGTSCDFRLGDASALALERKFDIILCVTVLQHIIDPDRAQTAVHRLAEHLAPAGTLLLLEAAPTRPNSRCNTGVFCARPLAWYQNALHLAGLRIVDYRGVDPMPFKTWLLPHYRALNAHIALAALAMTTTLSLPLDYLLAPMLAHRSWHKVIVAQPTGKARAT
jgi:2-polyprenyl-3-methyl-5-hydroxy-6-metoxy-1,4-benzoquinol methylase